jgi:predicted phage tail protein
VCRYAKEGSAEYKAAVSAMTAAERESSAARAAEAMARDFSTRTQSDITDVIKRESAAREDLTELRISHERLQQEFRDKTASAVEKQSKAESVLMEERHKSEMATKAARDRIGTLERASQEAAHNVRQLTESLERQKQETYYLYTNYAQVASQLEDTKTALGRIVCVEI